VRVTGACPLVEGNKERNIQIMREEIEKEKKKKKTNESHARFGRQIVPLQGANEESSYISYSLGGGCRFNTR